LFDGTNRADPCFISRAKNILEVEADMFNLLMNILKLMVKRAFHRLGTMVTGAA